MRKWFALFLLLAIAVTPPLHAQTPPPATPQAPLKDENLTEISSNPVSGFTRSAADAADGFKFWARGEYLLWRVKNAPLPIPLVTTGDPVNDNPAGAIGQPGTRVLLGNAGLGFDDFSGMRITLGVWLDGSQTVGIEGIGFLLERRVNRFFATSDAAGNPLLALPFFNRTPGFTGEDALRISDPTGSFAGNVLVVSTLQLWGTEINGIFRLGQRSAWDFALLAGVRYMDLQESLQVLNQTNDFSVTPNTSTILNDRFATHNQFYGGQMGGRLSVHYDRISLDVTAKIALGATHQVVEIQGASTQTGPFAATPGTVPGGLYTQPSNVGRYTANQFTVLPATEFKLAYRITQRLQVFAGYDFLYWSQVVRPGNQIDRQVNLTQSTVLGGFGGVLNGPAAPVPLFNRSDFWAQGVSFGLEFRF